MEVGEAFYAHLCSLLVFISDCSEKTDSHSAELFSQLSLTPPANESKRVPIRPRKNSHKTSESQYGEETSIDSPKGKSDCTVPINGASESADILREMFPTASKLEINHCLCVAKGSVDEAIPLILHRQETGDAIKESHVNVFLSSC
jgi:hypothetical protein